MIVVLLQKMIKTISEMKKGFFSTTFFVVMLGVVMGFTACGNSNREVSESVSVDEIEPDTRFATIDSLAEFMAQQFADNTSLSKLESNYQACSDAIMSYWALNHKGEDDHAMTDIVFNELKAVADKLAEGSTTDMMESGDISSAVAHYLTAKYYCDDNRSKPLYQAEMRDWLQFENELAGFYGQLATLANWGGSIAKVIASGSRVFLAEKRDDDYSQLKKGGNFPNGEPMPISEARANLIQELESAKSLEDDLVNDENYRKSLKEMREKADNLVVLLDKWLESRKKLCEAESIPEAHTAHFVDKLSRHIMEIIEG